MRLDVGSFSLFLNLTDKFRQIWNFAPYIILGTQFDIIMQNLSFFTSFSVFLKTKFKFEKKSKQIRKTTRDKDILLIWNVNPKSDLNKPVNT